VQAHLLLQRHEVGQAADAAREDVLREAHEHGRYARAEVSDRRAPAALGRPLRAPFVPSARGANSAVRLGSFTASSK
jgi:hypothetical protein